MICSILIGGQVLFQALGVGWCTIVSLGLLFVPKIGMVGSPSHTHHPIKKLLFTSIIDPPSRLPQPHKHTPLAPPPLACHHITQLSDRGTITVVSVNSSTRDDVGTIDGNPGDGTEREKRLQVRIDTQTEWIQALEMRLKEAENPKTEALGPEDAARDENGRTPSYKERERLCLKAQVSHQTQRIEELERLLEENNKADSEEGRGP